MPQNNVTLPPGFEDAQPVKIQLPAGFEDAAPVQENAIFSAKANAELPPEAHGRFDNPEANTPGAEAERLIGLGTGLAGAALAKPIPRMVPAGRNALGQMLPWVEEQGPSLLKQGAQFMAKEAAKHPKLTKIAATALGLKALRQMGISPRDIIDAIIGEPKTP